MNRIYRLIWNKKRNMLMAVSECATSRGKDAGGEAAVAGVTPPDQKKSKNRFQLINRQLARTSVLSAAIFAVFPLTSYAQILNPQSYVINNGQTLTLSDNDSSNSDAANYLLTDDGTLDISGTNAGSSIQSIGGSGSVLLGDQTLTVTNANDSFAGTIDGSGGLVIMSGTETLSGIHSYTGVTTISNGSTLSLDGSGGIASSSSVINEGVLDISATSMGTSIQSLSGSGGVVLGGQTLTLTNAYETFAGSIDGAGGLSIMGGVENLSGYNTYTGATTIGNGSTLSLSGSGAIMNSLGVTNDGVLDISATNNGTGIQSLSGSGSVILGGQTLTLTNAYGTFSGAISGSGGLTVSSGNEILSGANTYTGLTTISTGSTLSLSGSGGIANSASVLNFGDLDISATNAAASVKSLSGSGSVILGGQTLTLTNASDTFSGSIGGSGGLTVTGGTETLSGVNTYTGNTTVKSGGVLRVFSDANMGASNGHLNLNNGSLKTSSSFGTSRDITLSNIGTIDVATSTTVTSSGTISGSGTLSKAGSGTLVLSGNNTYNGGTTINTGTVQVSSDANLGGVNSNVSLNGGKLQTTSSFSSNRNVSISGQNGSIDTAGANTTLTLDGNLSGSGRLMKDGAGTLILAGDNAGGLGSGNTSSTGWTGGLTINGGLVEVTNPYGLGWGSVSLNGGTIHTSVDILTGNAMGLGLGTNINTDANTTTTLSGDIVSNAGPNACFTKTGLGTLNVAGNAQIDSTCVVQGKLLANGNLQSVVTVEQGGTLGGSGVINGPVIVRGTLSPGNSPGMLTANSTVTMVTGSRYQEDIAGTQQASAASPIGVTGYYSYLHVTGTNQFVIQPGVTLAPALKNIFSIGETGYGSAPFVPSIGQSYRIITADGGITGKFDTTVQPDGLAAGTRVAAFYNVAGSNSVDLKVLPSSYTSVSTGMRGNSRSAAAALDQIADMNQAGTSSATQDSVLYFAGSQTIDTLPNFVKGLSGEIRGALAAATPQSGWEVQKTVGKHLSESFGARADSQKTDRALWIDLGGNHGKWSADDAASGFTNNRTQITVGADVFHAPGVQLGVGYSHAQSNVSADLGSGSIAQNKAFVYGQYGWNGLILDGLASYGVDNVDSRRIDPTGLAATALTSHANGNSSVVGIGVRAPWQFNGATYEPYGRLTLQHVVRYATNEGTASSASLTTGRFSATGTRVQAGLSGSSSKKDPLAVPYTYKFNVGLGADAGSLSRITEQANLAGVSTSISAPHAGRTFVDGGIMGTVRLNRQSYFYISVNGEARSGYADIGGNVGVRMSF